MKKLFFLIVFCFFLKGQSQTFISDNGHPEHAIVGFVIGGTVSYLVYKKTGNKFKAWVVGAASASVAGYLKEVLDPPLFGGVRSDKDLMFTALGGVVGASIVIPLKKRKPKETPNITAAFQSNNSIFLQ